MQTIFPKGSVLAVFPNSSEAIVATKFMKVLVDMGYTMGEVKDSCAIQFPHVEWNWEGKTDA